MGLYADNLKKEYGERAVVDGVSVHVKEGEIVGLLGPNGAGKTTTFYMIVGLVEATTGLVRLEEEAIGHLPMHKRARKGIGYLPQEASVFRKLTVQQNIEAVAELLSISPEEKARVVAEHLEELHLTHLANQMAYTLSGGERRRLEISRALVMNPKYILMDEPFSGVDPINVADVQSIILKLKKRGIGILITDHNVRETLKIVDRAYLIHQGKVLCEGTSDFLINDEMSRRFYFGTDFNL